MQKVLDYISRFINEGDTRSVNAKKNILAMIFLRGLNILTGFLIVPITINYVNASIYGIWLALSSIVIWISYFDFGLPNGFRNKFAEAKAKNDIELARSYVSTTYCVMSFIFLTILIAMLIFNEFVNWSTLLNVDITLQKELHDVFIVLSIFFCLRVIASVFTFMLFAEQKPAFAAAVQTIGQVLTLSIIYILTCSTQGNLFLLALTLSGIPCMTIIIISAFSFLSSHYRTFAPSTKYIRLELFKDIIGKGIQFFFVSIIILLILQFINIAISRELGPLQVTEYNISFKYFSVVYMAMELLVSPFWSGFTEAYTQKEYAWMSNMLHRLEQIVVLSIPGIFVMLLCANIVIRLWIGDEVIVPISLSIMMAIFVFFQSAYCVYSNLINGTSKIWLQTLLFIVSACLSFPAITIGIRIFGLWGCLVFPTIIYIIAALLCRIQIKKLVSQRASGIWNK